MRWISWEALYPYLLVGIGGAIGSCIRHGVSCALPKGTLGLNLPLATSIVNIAGCFILGCLAGAFDARTHSTYLFMGVGFCGGLTTFSSFSLELVEQIQQGRFGSSLLECAINLILGSMALYVGYTLTHRG